jgi:acetyltransferase-like isoleucine patch superfamily enzyme
MVSNKIKGSLKCAQEQGMCVEAGVTVMGNVNFGSEPYLITLRKNCRISTNVVFVTHDGGTYAFRCFDKYKNVVKYGKIEVGENSFIGAGSIILPGVKIGSHCVIGAGSVVTKDVPDKTVVCGVPAKHICTLEEYAEKCKFQMPEYFDFEEYSKDKKKYLISVIK